MRHHLGKLIVAAVVIGSAALACWPHARTRHLRAQLGRELAASRAASALQTVPGISLLPMVQEGEYILLEDLAKARIEVAALRQQAEALAAERAAAHFAVGEPVPMSEWKNAGHATANAALETVLCAGASGDVDTFARSLLLINPATRAAAQELLRELPQEMRRQYPTPEKLIAFLSVKDVPLGTVEIRHATPLEGWPAPAQLFNLLISGEDGRHKDVPLVFMQSAGGWKLVVTESVVTKYAASLKGPEARALR